MDEMWAEFKETKPESGYYEASNEQAITLCSYGKSAPAAFRAMSELMMQYDSPLPIAASVNFEDDIYYLTVSISGFQIEG